MTRKQKRIAIIAGGMVFLAAAAGLVLTALNQEIVFFRAPTDLAETPVPPGQRIRIGGLVVEGSVIRGEGTNVAFAVTDTEHSIDIRYDGILPDLFREGQGIVAEGMMNADGSFTADTVLAKHDETYMPKEVADSLKDKGVWQGSESN